MTLVRVLFGCWLILTGVGTAVPGLRLWGVHLPAFLPLWGQVIFFGTALAFVFLPQRLFAGTASGVPRILLWLVRSPLSAVVVVGAFFLFRVSAGLLGDGTLRGREAQLGITRPAEALSGYFASWVYDLVHPAFEISGQDAVALTSVIAGCVFLLLLWFFPRRLWDDPPSRMTARMILATSGLAALFFGYIESYAVPCCAMIGFLLAAESCRRGKGSFFTAVFFFIAGLAAHFATVVLFPALVILALMPDDRRRWRLLSVGIIGVVLAAWGYWVLYASFFAQEAPTGSLLVPLLSRPPLQYGLISPAHLLDIVNLFYLVLPGVLIAAPLLFSRRIEDQTIEPRAYWLLAVCVPLCIPLFMDPKLGMSRDWDLLTLGLIPLVVWAAVRLADRRPALPKGALVLPVFAATTVLAMFVGINGHTLTAMDRFEKLLTLDEVRGGYGHEILATAYRDLDYAGGEIRHWHKALRLGDNKRYWANLAAAYLRVDNLNAGFSAARRAYLMDTSWAVGAFYLGTAFSELDLVDSASTYFARAARLDPDHDAIRYEWALALNRLGLTDDAEKQIHIALQLSPNNGIYHNALAGFFLQAERFNEAERELQVALQLDRQHANTRLNFVLLYYKTGRREQALAELARVAQSPTLSPEQRERITALDKRIREEAPAPGSGD